MSGGVPNFRDPQVRRYAKDLLDAGYTLSGFKRSGHVDVRCATCGRLVAGLPSTPGGDGAWAHQVERRRRRHARECPR